MKLKLCAYLDEAGEDHVEACNNLRSLGIKDVALRQVWHTNILNATDVACGKLKDILNGFNVPLLASDLGYSDIHTLLDISDDKIERIFNLAQYFKSKYIRIGWGTGLKRTPDGDAILAEWQKIIIDYAVKYNVIPVYEVTNQSYIYKSVDLAVEFKELHRWKLQYDPAQLLVKQNIDPFVKYWVLLKNHVGVIDIHDYRIGHGHKPPGFGDAMLSLLLQDATKNGYKGLYVIEPALGRRYNVSLSKKETFAVAVESLEAMLSR